MASPNQGRHIVLAVDLSAESFLAVQWAVDEFCRAADTLHLVHVARIMSPQYTIQHGYSGSSYSIPDVGPPIDERAYVEHVKEQFKARFTSRMDARGMAHQLHLYVDSKEAPASDVGAIIFKVAAETAACLVVLAAHNKAKEIGWDSLFIGSVAEYAVKNAKVPVMVVRNYGDASQAAAVAAAEVAGQASGGPAAAAAPAPRQ